MGSCLSPTANKVSHSSAIQLSIHPSEWDEQQIIHWLQQTKNNLSHLVKPFQKHRISGPVFVNLTAKELQNELKITQFGLVKEFLIFRDNLLSHYDTDTADISHTHSNRKFSQTPSSETIKNTIETSPFLREENLTLFNTQCFDMETLALPPTNHRYQLCDVRSIDLKWTEIAQRDSTHSPTAKECNINICDYSFMEQYSDIAYIGGSKLVIDGCIRALSLVCGNDRLINTNKISELTHKYYFESDKHLFQFGFDIWKILHKINRSETVNGIETKSFLGNCLIIEMRSQYWTKYRFGDMLRYCNDLLKHSFIALIAVKEGSNSNDCECYVNSAQYLYTFLKSKKRKFKKFHNFRTQLLDRHSWCRGTQIEIFSHSLKGWQCGEILQINGENNSMKVSYLNHEMTNNRYLLKTVNKNDTNLVRSTKEYIINRNKWRIGTEIEIFSFSERQWCLGIIENIIAKDANNESIVDLLCVKYQKESDGLYYTKSIDLWSSNVRDIQEMTDEKLLKFKNSKQCKVYSPNEAKWIVHNVCDVIPMHKYVVVQSIESHKTEKIIHINSGLIKSIE